MRIDCTFGHRRLWRTIKHCGATRAIGAGSDHAAAAICSNIPKVHTLRTQSRRSGRKRKTPPFSWPPTDSFH
eukprot:6294072-Pyramimonas_sp.AAC.1